MDFISPELSNIFSKIINIFLSKILMLIFEYQGTLTLEFLFYYLNVIHVIINNNN